MYPLAHRAIVITSFAMVIGVFGMVIAVSTGL